MAGDQVDCTQFLELVHPWVDGELDFVQTLKMETHLNGCATCLSEFVAIRDLKSRLKPNILKIEMPPYLAKKIIDGVRSERQLAEVKMHPNKKRDFQKLIFLSPINWLFSGSLVGAVTTFLVMSIIHLNPFPTSKLTLNELVNCHIRSLQVDHLFDIESTDQHTVKPWFQGRLDYSPPVQDFSQQGFQLMGGRLDYLKDKPVAVLVYKKNLHLINIFCEPNTNLENKTSSNIKIKGYNILLWTRNDFRFSVVSDLNEVELNQLAQLISAKL